MEGSNESMKKISKTGTPNSATERRKNLGIGVLEAAKKRIAYCFDNFPRIYVSFSGGKDSTVMTHLVMDEAIRRGKKVGLLFVDLEAQYKLTIDHVREMFALYAGHIDPHWCAESLSLRNAVSQFEPKWLCWDTDRIDDWVRPLPEESRFDYPFHRVGMEFEEFVPKFGHWFGGGELTCCFVGIRTDESLNRWRTIAGGRKQAFEGCRWTTWCGRHLYNAYPIYDWKTEDIWTYHGKTGLPYNRLYDLMHKAGLTIHQMRICQPYGDDQRKGLWLFHLIEPETWGRVVARVSGANQGALYGKEAGNVMGNIKITLPEGHTWQSFAKMLLESMPASTREHYENKVAVFLKWYADRGYPNGIPDAADAKDEAARKTPSWRRICKAILRNDYWCKGLSFSQHKSEAYEKYLKLMKNRKKDPAWRFL